MFDNIGGKIKTLAKVICWVGIIASVIIAIALWSQNSYRNSTVALGFGVLIGGCVGSWVGSFFVYGFGELIEDTSAIREVLKIQGKPEKKLVTAEKPVIAPTVTKAYQKRVWTCTNCHFQNQAERDICAQCGAVKVRIVSSSWVCESCGLRNSSGTVCMDCGRSKE